MRAKQLSWIILITLSLVWGSSFILMKRGLEVFSSDEVAAIRISIAFLFLLPFLLKYKKIDLKKYLVGLLCMGVFGNFIPAFLFTKAETQISSSLTGMLNALTPLFTILVAYVWLKTKSSAIKIIGVLLGFIGALVLVYFSPSNQSNNNAIYSLLVVAATLCYAISITGIKKYLSDIDSITATVWAFMLMGPPALVYLLCFTDFTIHINNTGAASAIGYLSILAIVGTALSVIIYNNLIKLSGPVFASSCTYLIPVVAIAWGLFDGEAIDPMQLVSIGIIIFSIYLINYNTENKIKGGGTS